MLRTLSLTLSLLLLTNVGAAYQMHDLLINEFDYTTSDDNSTDSEPTPNKSMYLNDTFISGYVNIDAKDQLYYILFESRSKPEEDPLLIWLQGGPGCSSELGLFTENGPYNVAYDRHAKPTHNITNNPYSWNNNSNVLYLD